MLEIFSKSKALILGTVLLIVFIAEVLVMGILYLLQFESAFIESIVDGVLLSFFSAPFIYHFLIRDISIKNRRLIESLRRQKRAEDALLLSQDELRRLSEKLIQSEEEQRKTIAFELHDSIGQSIFAIKLGIENLLQQHALDIADPVKEVLLNQLIKLQRASEEVRDISMNLRPMMLDDLGLLAAINWLTREFRPLYPNTFFDLEFDLEEKDLPSHLKIVIYRIVQESLNNMGKHAKASCVKITLGVQNCQLLLTIDDDGQGFEISDTYFGKGIGLSSMKERVKLSKGVFSVASKLGNGTMIRAQWDL